jgi:hypothetical protein
MEIVLYVPFQPHLQFTLANTQPKIAKEPSNPSYLIKKQMDKNENIGMIM